LFDGDSAGLKAAMRTVPFFLAEQVEARVAVLPAGHDPDSYVRENGPESVNKLVTAASPLAEFVFATLSRQYGMTLDGKNKIVAELQEIIAAGDDSMQRSLMIAHFSEMLGISPDQFEKVPVHGARDKKELMPSSGTSLKNLPRKERQLLDFVIMYPEYFQELIAAGIEMIVSETAVLNIFTVLKRLTGETLPTPDRLLTNLEEGSAERQYVAELLILGEVNGGGDNEVQVRRKCDELLLWLRTELKRRDSASLEKQIKKAQDSGDEVLLMELMNKILGKRRFE
jgi:DNA primase